MKIKPYKYAHFEIPIYRIPVLAFFILFIPVWILGGMSLLLFFTKPVLIDRIGSISTLMLTYVAFMPTIRSALPPTPKVTFIEILIYL